MTVKELKEKLSKFGNDDHLEVTILNQSDDEGYGYGIDEVDKDTVGNFICIWISKNI